MHAYAVMTGTRKFTPPAPGTTQAAMPRHTTHVCSSGTPAKYLRIYRGYSPLNRGAAADHVDQSPKAMTAGLGPLFIRTRLSTEPLSRRSVSCHAAIREHAPSSAGRVPASNTFLRAWPREQSCGSTDMMFPSKPQPHPLGLPIIGDAPPEHTRGYYRPVGDITAGGPGTFL